MVAQTRHGGSPKKKLAFNEKLVTKGLSTDALLKKLKALHTQLAGIDQEHIDLSSLGSIRKELVNTSILLHKDRGVKAYTACCLADILRLYAPDAPYTQAELRDIFQFFFRQLTKGLQGSDASYYDQYFHLLESLSTVKSVVLVCDLPNAEDLIVEVFRDFFNLVKRDLAKKIEIFMTDILVALIDECQSLPTEALETLMSQFIDKNARIEHPAYRLAVDVCNATADKLQRHVCQYFSDIIVSNAREEELEEIRTSHELVKRLHHSCPALLHSVIPQLEEELRAEETELRLIVTQTLGDMFADKGGADLVKKYPTTWNLWLSRKNDRSSGIRVKFVEATRGLLTALPEFKKEIEVSLDAKLMDPDEKVRAAVCKVYAQLDYETALHYVSDDVLRAIAGRGLDKKQIVRVEALNCLGKLYSLAYPEIENGEPLAIKQFSWIPNEILQMLTVRTEVRNIIEQVIMDHILPLPSSTPVPSSKSNEIDEVAWTDRLLYTLQYLDEKSVKALLNLSGLKTLRPNIFDHFVEACIKNNGGIIDENEELVVRKLNAVVQHIAATYQDPHKAAEDLNSFAKLNEGRLYKLLKTCMDPQTDLKGLIKATAEFCRRLEQSSASILPTLLVLLRRSSFRIINQSSIPTLIKRIQKTCPTTPHAQTLLTCASKHVPALFKAHIGELAKAIADEKNALLVEVCLQALAGVVKWDGALAPTDKRTNERVARIVLQSNHRHAKFAARILAFSKHRQEACGKAVESIAENIASSDPETSLAHISVLTQFSRFVPESFEDKSDVLMSYLLKSVLMVPTPPNSDDMDLGEEWAEEHELSLELQARILVLKVCRNRGLAHATSEKALETSAPTLKMLATLLEYGGCFNIESPEDPKVMSRMRLQAAISLLHLSTVDTYADAIAPKFLRLALVMQDSCYNVRIGFLTKLLALLQPRKLPPRYNVIPFLTVHDPEQDVKMMASTYVTTALRKLNTQIRVESLEIIFIRLIHLLAHHPDFSTAHDDLLDIVKYMQFYLDLVCTPESVSLLYHLAMKGKTVRDSGSDEYSENFYLLCELAQELIKTRAKAHAWTIQSYPGKVRLPSDILRPLPNADVANKILKTTFLPEETVAWLAELAKPSHARVAPKERKERRTSTTGKRKAPSKTNGSAKRARASKKWNSDQSESEDEPSDSELSDADVPVSSDKLASKVTSEPEPEESEDGSEKLGRGARTRAKTRSKRLAKPPAKRSRTETPTSDD